MNIKIEIKNRWTREVIFSGEYETIKAAVVDAIAKGKNLSGVNLCGTNLRGANLQGANLQGADLCRADLSGADLSGADLSGAYLNGAYLIGAYLHDANLRSADLHDANLRGANLSDANLRDANLSDANLRAAGLRSANLSGIKADFIAEVLKLPFELEFLRAALIEGNVDGSTYTGECACLAGALAHAKGIANYTGNTIEAPVPFLVDANSPRERFFLAIRKGDTPETNPVSKIALEWTDEAIRIRDAIISQAAKGSHNATA